MAIYFQKNLKYLRKKSGKNQTDIGFQVKRAHTSIGNWEKGTTEPTLSELVALSQYFEIPVNDLVNTDLENVHLNEKNGDSESSNNVHLNVRPTVHLNAKNDTQAKDITITVAAEPDVNYGQNVAIIPITNINVAAGAGHFNPDHIEGVEALHMPIQLLKRNSTYLCVKIKGVSMAPTLQDGGYVIIRLIDKSKWAEMQDESVHVVSDIYGQTFLKRVKNRFKQGFIVMRSDSPDRATFPTFNLFAEDINTVWAVDWYFSAKMPNIHDQFYSRLQVLEDRVDEIERSTL